MKVFFLNVGMTPYYNQIFNRLNALPDVEMHLVVPQMTSSHVGQGVFETEKYVKFHVHRLKEFKRLAFYSSFKGLARLFLKERPDIVISTIAHVHTFVFSLPVIFVMKLLGIKLVLHNIPFRLLKYEEAKWQGEVKAFAKLPRWLRGLVRGLGVERGLRILYVLLMKLEFNLPDAHLVYVDAAYDIYGSYGVPREKIFVTRNSPDTDELFAVREQLEKEPPVLPPSEQRLIHVGRLVGWKRVDLLVRALARVKGEFTSAELLVAGFGPEENSLRQLAAELGVNDSVHFLGGIYEPADLGRYFLVSSVYVLAGMGGLSINDAMAFGLPVVCSVCDGTEKKLVREGYNGMYFREGDEDDLVRTIRWLFAHPEERRTMGRNSTAIIRDEVNIHTVVRAYEEAFAFLTAYRET